MKTLLYALHSRDRGQTMAEYAVLLAVVCVVVIAALMLLSDGISEGLGNVIAVLG